MSASGDQYLTPDELSRFKVDVEDPDTGETRAAYEIGGEYYPLSQRFMWWHRHILPVGDGFNAQILAEIERRRNTGRSNIALVTGPAGEGKSWWSLAFAQLFDPKFRIVDVPAPPPGEDPSQVCFDRAHILHLIGNDSPLRRGQVVVIDEAQYAANIRRWYESVQVDLMESIESVRSRGLIILIVALHRSLLDKVLRNYVLNFQFHVEDWGRAVAYSIRMPRFEENPRYYRMGTLELPIPDGDLCPSNQCLRCNYLWGSNSPRRVGRNPQKRLCKTLRAIYERRKHEYVGRQSLKAKRRAEAKTQKAAGTVLNNPAVARECVALIHKKIGELGFTKYGNLNKYDLKILLERERRRVFSSRELEFLVKLHRREHPGDYPAEAGGKR